MSLQLNLCTVKNACKVHELTLTIFLVTNEHVLLMKTHTIAQRFKSGRNRILKIISFYNTMCYTYFVKSLVNYGLIDFNDET